METLEDSLEQLDEQEAGMHAGKRPQRPASDRGRNVTTQAVDALRSAAPDAYFVLDDEDRVFHVSLEFHDTRGRGVGHMLWDHLPAARAIYGRRFDEARRPGSRSRQ